MAEVRDMFRKLTRQGREIKRQVINMYKIEVLSDNKDGRNTMLNKPIPRANERMLRVTVTETRGSDLQCVKSGVLGVLEPVNRFR